MGKSTIISDFKLSMSLGSITLSGNTPPSSLTIVGPDTASGSFRAAKYSIKYFPASASDRAVDWSITSGGQYASIDAQGELTIYHGANSSSVTIQASLHSDSTISATKTISVSFPALPAEYQDVEYLEGDGDAYIDLGFKAHLANDSAMLKCQVAADTAFYVGANDNSTRQFYFCNIGAKAAQIGYAKCVVYTSSKYSSSKICNDGLPHVFHFDGSARKFFFDGSLVGDSYVTNNNETYGNMKLFGTSFNGNFVMKIYSYMHFRYGEIYMNCVPCYRKADDVAGMFDLVSGTFFTNSGDGSFTCGEDI